MPQSADKPAPPPSPSRWTITLQPDPASRGWRADLHADAELQHFDSLRALIDWLVQREPPPPRGIR